MDHNFKSTELEYYDEMWKLQSTAILLSSFLVGCSSIVTCTHTCTQNTPSKDKLAEDSFKGEDGRHVMILDSTIFHPQGGGQPSDTGFITISDLKFVVQDVRSKDKIVYHFGFFENTQNGVWELKLEKGAKVFLVVDEERRKLNSRLHSAGHLLDACMKIVGLGHLEPGKGYHFPDGPFVEYKGTIQQNALQSKQQELELEASKMIAQGGKVFASLLPYEEAVQLCGGCLPDYIPQGSTPRIVKLGENPGCPCGGTHVSDISEILSLKVSQIRTKKGMTKVFYSLGS